METILLTLRGEVNGNVCGLSDTGMWGGEPCVRGSSGRKLREIDSLMLPLGLILWLIRTCK